MPPTGVLISTCLSCPFCSLRTFTLQAVRNKIANPRPPRVEMGGLFLDMPRPSCGYLSRTLQTRAALGNVRYGDRKMAMNRNLSEQSFYRGYFGDRCVGKRAHVILDFGKIARQIRIT